MDEVLKKINDGLNKLTVDMSEEIPTGSDPQSIKKIKQCAAHASANAAPIASYLRWLEQTIKEEEAKIALDNIDKLKSPREEYLKSLYKSRLSKHYALQGQCIRMLDILKQRVMLAQSYLRSNTSEDFISSGTRLNIE